jgi:hypothetical protein
MNTQYVILGAVLVLVILLTISCACSEYKPYSPSEIFSKNFAYEGFEGGEMGEDEPSMNEEKEVEEEVEEEEEGKATEGFQGLQSSPYVDEKPIDVFSSVKGSLECDKKSSNLHNSRGGLCLSSEQLNLLKTRGMNSTGGDFQIGK